MQAETDVVVVGSGAGGGMAAYALARAGVRVLMLETGRHYDAVREAPMFKLPSEAPLRGAATPDKQGGYYDATVNGGWQIPGEPYVVADGSRFMWWRARMLGGRTNHWGRMSLRFGPDDFRGFSRDGLGVDWPLSYEELAPYYDQVEGLIGVFGAASGIENSPDSPPGLLHVPPKPRAFEAWMKLFMGRRHGIPVVPAHMAILTRQHGDRPACMYATDCQRGCSIRANFQSPTVLLPPAMATGKMTLRTNAMVYEVMVDRRGLAAGVRYLDARNGVRHEVRARAVVLAASTCESARILLNSQSVAFPNGLGNAGGQVGRNLTDTPAYSVSAQIPQLEDLPPFNDEGVTLYHVYTPWWLHREQAAGKLGFARGYHIEYWGGRRMPEFEDMVQIAELSGQYGRGLRRDMRRLYGSIVSMSARGEMLPNAGSYCELDPRVKDKWDVPVLRFHWAWGPEEMAQMQHAQTTLGAVFESMGARLLTDVRRPIAQSMRSGGSVVHEAGACRMGKNPQDSVLDRFGRCWGTRNLYVLDAGAFSGSPHKNPTLTILALAWRGADHLADALRRRDL
jgi:choline dehydrogenase-like flavoprotein